MEEKTVTFTVVVRVDRPDWQKDIRAVRKVLKEQIGGLNGVKILKLDTKEG